MFCCLWGYEQFTRLILQVAPWYSFLLISQGSPWRQVWNSTSIGSDSSKIRSFCATDM